MPQMAPMYWLSLLCFFCFILIAIIMLNYYIKAPTKITSKIHNLSCLKTSKFKWKW